MNLSDSPARPLEKLPLVPLRDMVVFPQQMAPFVVGRDSSIRALEAALATPSKRLFLAAQKNPQLDEPEPKDIFEVGVVATVAQSLKLPNGHIKVMCEGVRRAKIRTFEKREDYLGVVVEPMPQRPADPEQLKEYMGKVLGLFEQYAKLSHTLAFEGLAASLKIDEPERFADTLSAHLTVATPDKQMLLEAETAAERLQKLQDLLEVEIEKVNIDRRINNKVKKQMEKAQKEYYLNEKIKAIHQELGRKDDRADEVEDLKKKIATAGMPKEVREKAEQELKRLEAMPPVSAEATVSRNYIEWLVGVPWKKASRESKDLTRAEKILNDDHYGLEKVKERILEFLAVRQLVQKTKKAGTVNPVFLLDEVDKMSSDFRGDPASALLEVLDPEQNHTFVDHYLDVEYDLSKVMFIATANIADPIPPALKDRMELIPLSGYTPNEKVAIARQFLVPKQRDANGLKAGQIEFSDETILALITAYTREAGVRNLEREIGSICRKVARRIVQNKAETPVQVTPENVREFLGKAKFRNRRKGEISEVGIATGLAWTESGGEILMTETSLLKGKGNLTLTGSLGDVMKESARAAVSYVRSRAEMYDADPNFHEKFDIHIHVPEGAIPKDGPSAGITMAVSLFSAVTKIPVLKDVAMTGEITLRGKVLPVGGIKDKVLAAFRAGIRTITLSAENDKDLDDLPDEIRSQMEFHLVSNMDEVIKVAMEGVAAPAPSLPPDVKPVEGDTVAH